MKRKQYNTVILGAAGLVGKELFSILLSRSFPLGQLFLLGSSSVGQVFTDPNGTDHEVRSLDGFSWKGIDFLFSCVENVIAQRVIPEALHHGVTVIDNSSHYRLQDSVPLIIPEINGEKLSKNTTLVANPNCTAVILLMGLFPVIQKWGVSQCIATTYQAMGGGGIGLLQKLFDQTQEVLQQKHPPDEESNAFNLYPHESALLQTGYCEEEDKIMKESTRILENYSFPLSPFCVRVPVLRAHSIHLFFTIKTAVSLENIVNLYQKQSFPGILYYQRDSHPRWATPNLVSGKDEVYVGKIRKDIHHENTFEMWIVGDQLRKGAALNAVQIAERILFFRDGI